MLVNSCIRYLDRIGLSKSRKSMYSKAPGRDSINKFRRVPVQKSRHPQNIAERIEVQRQTQAEKLKIVSKRKPDEETKTSFWSGRGVCVRRSFPPHTCAANSI